MPGTTRVVVGPSIFGKSKGPRSVHGIIAEHLQGDPDVSEAVVWDPYAWQKVRPPSYLRFLWATHVLRRSPDKFLGPTLGSYDVNTAFRGLEQVLESGRGPRRTFVGIGFSGLLGLAYASTLPQIGTMLVTAFYPPLHLYRIWPALPRPNWGRVRARLIFGRSAPRDKWTDEDLSMAYDIASDNIRLVITNTGDSHNFEERRIQGIPNTQYDAEASRFAWESVLWAIRRNA